MVKKGVLLSKSMRSLRKFVENKRERLFNHLENRGISTKPPTWRQLNLENVKCQRCEGRCVRYRRWIYASWEVKLGWKIYRRLHPGYSKGKKNGCLCDTCRGRVISKANEFIDGGGDPNTFSSSESEGDINDPPELLPDLPKKEIPENQLTGEIEEKEEQEVEDEQPKRSLRQRPPECNHRTIIKLLEKQIDDIRRESEESDEKVNDLEKEVHRLIDENKKLQEAVKKMNPRLIYEQPSMVELPRSMNSNLRITLKSSKSSKNKYFPTFKQDTLDILQSSGEQLAASNSETLRISSADKNRLEKEERFEMSERGSSDGSVRNKNDTMKISPSELRRLAPEIESHLGENSDDSFVMSNESCVRFNLLESGFQRISRTGMDDLPNSTFHVSKSVMDVLVSSLAGSSSEKKALVVNSQFFANHEKNTQPKNIPWIIPYMSMSRWAVLAIDWVRLSFAYFDPCSVVKPKRIQKLFSKLLSLQSDNADNESDIHWFKRQIFPEGCPSQLDEKGSAVVCYSYIKEYLEGKEHFLGTELNLELTWNEMKARFQKCGIGSFNAR